MYTEVAKVRRQLTPLLRDVLASREWYYYPGGSTGLFEDRIGIVKNAPVPLEDVSVPARDVFEAMNLEPAILKPAFMTFRAAAGVWSFDDLGIAHADANNRGDWQYLADLTGKWIKAVWLDPASGRNAGHVEVTVSPTPSQYI